MFTANLLFCVKHPYEKDYYVGRHAHPCYEIVYYSEGEGEVSFGGKHHPFRKDTFMVCGPEVQHIEQGSKGTQVLYIGFELYGNVSLAQGVFEEKKYGIAKYLEDIYYETKHWTSRSRQLINLFTSIIVIKLLQPVEGKARLTADHDFDNVVAYISAHYQEDITVEKLAQMAGYSYDHFRKMFRQKFKMSVNDFILQKRLEAANNLLKNQKLPVKVVAANCGFSSVSQFCTKYREAMGITPKQMQKNSKLNEQNAEDEHSKYYE